MKIQCPNCAQPTELTFQVNWKDFACPHCNTLFNKDEGGNPKQARFLPRLAGPLSLQIGQQGVLEDTLWEAGGICTKKLVNEPYGWQEYTLYSAKGGVCFLSEYNGHWILAKEIEAGEKFSIEGNHGCNYRDDFFPPYHDSDFRTEYAAGIFDHPVPEAGTAKDFVNPPYALLLEQIGQDTYAFDARHVSKEELTAAFPDIELPERVGQGMLQPFHFNVLQFCAIWAGVGGIVLLCQLLLSGFYPTYKVLSEHIFLPDTVATVTHVTPSFACTGLLAPVQVSLSAPVNNSWAAVDFCLVNEETKEERYGSVEVAYYFGSDQDGSWTEGTSRPSIKICGVSPGPYHLVMQVSKEPNRPDLNALDYIVTARAPTAANLLWSLGLLAVMMIAAFLWQAHFEKMRWMNSDFPPEEGG